MTINQAAGQSDPTNASPINFTVVFSESVTGFAAGDVTLTGTAGATTATVTGSGTTYNVAVSGMTSDGTVIATVAGGRRAPTRPSNGNTASTSTDNTVTYDTTAPTVTINQAAGQADPTNASPINFTVVFSESVTGFADRRRHAQRHGGRDDRDRHRQRHDLQRRRHGMTSDGTVIATIAGRAAPPTRPATPTPPRPRPTTRSPTTRPRRR